MTQEEIATRRPVWVALSDLFLDTDVRLSYSYIARTLAQSPFTIEQLDSIFEEEVSPVLAFNLCSIAGEWAGFDEEWLVSEILGRNNPSRVPSLGAARDDWEAVALLVRRLRLFSPDARLARTGAWTHLSKLFLNRDPALAPLDLTPEELEEIWRIEMWPAYGRTVDAYRKHLPKTYPNREEVEQSWQKWKSSR